MSSSSPAVNTYDSCPEIPSGMLSSPHIRFCVEKYKIFSQFKESCLTSATYHMRLGGKILTWEGGEKKAYDLGEEVDLNKNIKKEVKLKPNSLTFVTTIEKFNLPKDIIARFNLKSGWVHKGLLLGTGPIVDPELQANLLIPLHNFSNDEVVISYGEKLISVEFTKTLNPSDTFDLKNGQKAKYIENDNWNFDFDGYLKRLGGHQVESSIFAQRLEYQKTYDRVNKTLEDVSKKFDQFSFVGALTLAGTFVGLIVLVFTTWMLINDAYQKANQASSLIQHAEKQSFDVDNFALSSSVDELRRDVYLLVDRNKKLADGMTLLKLENKQLSLRLNTVTGLLIQANGSTAQRDLKEVAGRDFSNTEKSKSSDSANDNGG